MTKEYYSLILLLVSWLLFITVNELTLWYQTPKENTVDEIMQMQHRNPLINMALIACSLLTMGWASNNLLKIYQMGIETVGDVEPKVDTDLTYFKLMWSATCRIARTARRRLKDGR